MIICNKCGAEKPLSEYHLKKNGNINSKKCKECTKEDVRENRKSKVEYYREYDRKRGSRQDYQYVKEYREKYPKKYHAHILVNNSLRNGILIKQSCEICGEVKTVAHHDDYDKPLDIRWLCQAHHVQWHKQFGEGLNPI